MTDKYIENMDQENRKRVFLILLKNLKQALQMLEVFEDDKKFTKGDILMAAGYNAPARNKPRGNIFENYHIQWTGPRYLF